MSPVTLTGKYPCMGFPRVSGDEPEVCTLTGGWCKFSPRERG